MDHSTQIPICQITAGRNPRKYFDPVKMTEFEASIRVQGLLQPILLRPMGQDAYEIVAGERRYRAFRSVFGDAASIPAFVREMTDSAADAAALAENVDRESMTSVEEAEAAARILGECQGNRDEAAARLGWNRTKLDKRLALMYATDKVRDALQVGKILLGHAELLAVCRKEAQDAALDILLRQEKIMSVADFKSYIDRASLVLDTAIFDKTECSGCIHNSGNQSALFTEVISGGRCSNKECFDRKTEAELVVRETALKDDFQVVRIVRPGENLTLVPLQSEGPKGVGPDQAKACQVCKNFGAVVSAVPDKLGHVYKNMCMDVACNVRMVAAKVKKEAADPSGATPHVDGHSKELAAAHKKPPVDGKGKATEPSKKAKPPVTYPEPSARIKEYREKLWRAIYQRVVMKLDVADNRALLVAICLTHPSYIDADALRQTDKETQGIHGATALSQALAMTRGLDKVNLGALVQAIAAKMKNGPMGMPIADVVAVLESFGANVADHWKVGKEFFELLTKNEIDAVCEEIGIKASMGSRYAKARGESKEDFVKAIIAIPDFDYRGRIPKLMTW